MIIRLPMIILDQVMTHADTNLANDTVPPGITGLDWCHITSTVSFDELSTFLAANVPGTWPDNIRTPLLGAFVTYAGLSEEQRAAAILAGAKPQRQTYTFTHCFDYSALDPAPATYEP